MSMRPEELQAMGVSTEMASMPIDDLIRHNDRRANKVILKNLGMGEDIQPDTSKVPNFALSREIEVVTDEHSQVE